MTATPGGKILLYLDGILHTEIASSARVRIQFKQIPGKYTTRRNPIPELRNGDGILIPGTGPQSSSEYVKLPEEVARNCIIMTMVDDIRLVALECVIHAVQQNYYCICHLSYYLPMFCT